MFIYKLGDGKSDIKYELYFRTGVDTGVITDYLPDEEDDLPGGLIIRGTKYVILREMVKAEGGSFTKEEIEDIVVLFRDLTDEYRGLPEEEVRNRMDDGFVKNRLHELRTKIEEEFKLDKSDVRKIIPHKDRKSGTYRIHAKLIKIDVDKRISSKAIDYETDEETSRKIPFRASEKISKIYGENSYSFGLDPENLVLVGKERTFQLENLISWAKQEEEIRLCSILGASGCGKSKLAFELCRRLERENWNTLWIDRYYMDEHTVEDNLKALNGRVLIVVDDVQFCPEIFARIMNYLFGSESGSRAQIVLVRVVVTAYEETEELRRYRELVAKDYRSIDVQQLNKTELKELIGNYINRSKSASGANKTKAVQSIIEKLEELAIGDEAPLYALFMAQALCDGLSVEDWVQKDALEYAAKHIDRKITAALEDLDVKRPMKEAYRQAINLIRVVATMTGGVKIDAIEEMFTLRAMKFLANIDHWYAVIDILERCGLLDHERQMILGMRPEIAGKYFCLKRLTDRQLLNDAEFNLILRTILRHGRGAVIAFTKGIDCLYPILPRRGLVIEGGMVGYDHFHVYRDLRLQALDYMESVVAYFYFEEAEKAGGTIIEKAIVPDDGRTIRRKAWYGRRGPFYNLTGRIRNVYDAIDLTYDADSNSVERNEYRRKYLDRILLPEDNQNKPDLRRWYDSAFDATANYFSEISAVEFDVTIPSSPLLCGIDSPEVLRCFRGDTLWGQPHGKGTVTWGDGTTYVGSFKNGTMDYGGTFTHPDGRTYYCCLSSSIRFGPCTYIWKDGATYEGQWEGGVRHGTGKMTYPDGTIVESAWVDDRYAGSDPFPSHIDDTKYQVPQGRGPYALNPFDSGSIIDNYACPEE